MKSTCRAKGLRGECGPRETRRARRKREGEGGVARQDDAGKAAESAAGGAGGRGDAAGISEQLDRLSVATIETALDLLETGDELPVMLAVDCSGQLYLFSGDTPDGCYRAACEQVAALGAACTRYVLLYDGVVQADEASAGVAALLFEFAERGMEHAWSGCLPYGRGADGGVQAGEPVAGGEERLLFA